jgi:hypothetical protein
VARDITIHGLQRLQQRNISREDVESALNRPTGRITPGQPGSIWRWGYAVNGGILKVCVRADDPNTVITAAWPDR